MAHHASYRLAALLSIGLPVLLAPMLVGVSTATDMDRYGDPLPPGAVARLGTTRLGHSGVIHIVAFSPDGMTLGSASGGDFPLWIPANVQRIRPPQMPAWIAPDSSLD